MNMASSRYGTSAYWCGTLWPAPLKGNPVADPTSALMIDEAANLAHELLADPLTKLVLWGTSLVLLNEVAKAAVDANKQALLKVGVDIEAIQAAPGSCGYYKAIVEQLAGLSAEDMTRLIEHERAE
jgi:hypothetical protein